MTFQPEQLLPEFEDLLRTMPSRDKLHHMDPEIQEWIGRALALVNLWDPLKTPFFEIHVSKIHHYQAPSREDGIRGTLRTLQQARFELRMKTVGPLTIALGQGDVFAYFDEIRKVIEEATQDILFIDPYLDSEFVSRYLPQVKPGVAVRLLAQRRIQTLVPAVELLHQQFGHSVEIRTSFELHDRYLFIDRSSCYQSGASFKDGAKKSSTTLTQIVDAFPAIHSMYDQLWASGTKVFQA